MIVHHKLSSVSTVTITPMPMRRGVVSILKQHVFFIIVCCLLSIFTPAAWSNEKADNSSNITPASLSDAQKHLRQLQQVQTDLLSEIAAAQEQNLPLLAFLVDQERLLKQFVFDERFASLSKHLDKARELKDEGENKQAQVIVDKEFQSIVELAEVADLIDQTIKAEVRAEQTQRDSKMYFHMRVRSKIPPKVQKAYGLMELAKQERDNGHFIQALQMWDQAEVMVREAFNEHIQHMAEWREKTKKSVAEKRKRIKSEIEKLFENYFVKIPAGSFLMGSNSSGEDEQPVRKVSIPAFKMGKTEVTFELYDYCVESSACFSNPDDEGWGRADRPVINVSYWDITRRFLPWLNELMEQTYRLPTEAEWEYAARAGSDTEYSWGDNLTCEKARYDGGSNSVCDASQGKHRGTAPVMSYPANSFGLYDMHGNVWEWVEDCWQPTYQGAPVDGSANTKGSCGIRVLRGGAWDYNKNGLRSANRYYFPIKTRRPSYGFRLVLDESKSDASAKTMNHK